jgi:hypothetical protein
MRVACGARSRSFRHGIACALHRRPPPGPAHAKSPTGTLLRGGGGAGAKGAKPKANQGPKPTGPDPGKFRVLAPGPPLCAGLRAWPGSHPCSAKGTWPCPTPLGQAQAPGPSPRAPAGTGKCPASAHNSVDHCPRAPPASESPQCAFRLAPAPHNALSPDQCSCAPDLRPRGSQLLGGPDGALFWGAPGQRPPWASRQWPSVGRL